MIILKDAYVLTLNQNDDFGRYSILIDGKNIVEISRTGEIAAAEREKTKFEKWIEKYGSSAEIIDCSSKIIIPAIANACLKSEGTFIKYLMRNRHYENTTGDLFTDLVFNYLYQDSDSDEHKKTLESIYRYSFAKNLKSGVGMINEFSMRKDMSHLEPVLDAQKLSGQRISACYPIRQEFESLEPFRQINPSYYFTDENQMTIYDLSNMTGLKRAGIRKFFFEIATNKEVTDEFRRMFGKPVVKLLDEYSLVDSDTAFINPLYLSYDELKILSEKGAGVIICPRDLMNYSNRYFPVDDIIGGNIKFSIAAGWLGEDLFKEVRIFRNKFKELNIASSMLLKSITEVPYTLFSGKYDESNGYGIMPGNPADLSFIDINDIRFQFYPESMNCAHVYDFLIDNVSSSNFSAVMLNGEFKVKDYRLLSFDEDSVIKTASETREHLYKIAKYEEISEKQKNKKSVEKLELSYREDEEMKLFSEVLQVKETERKQEREEFRIKSKIPVFRRKTAPAQKNLFEEPDKTQIPQLDEYQETPSINLLYTEYEKAGDLEEEVQINKITEEKILKQAHVEKKKEYSSEKQEGKIELPKNVKLKFGDD